VGARPRRRGRRSIRPGTGAGILLTSGVDTSSAGIGVPVLHAVTNDEIVGRPDFLDRARGVMRAMRSRGAVHLRAPKMMEERGAAVVELALALAEEQERTGAWLVINDRVDVAAIVCARGVQLTGRSVDVADAAQILLRTCERNDASANFGAAIGASVHSLQEAIAARIGGASWGVVRDVLSDAPRPRETSSRQTESGPELLRRLVRFSGIPIIAIGGVSPGHVVELRRLGVHGVAAIRGVWDVEHSERAVIDYLSAYDAEVGREPLGAWRQD
jgi:thiazole tautomerase (transcriptional regulator TenI)